MNGLRAHFYVAVEALQHKSPLDDLELLESYKEGQINGLLNEHGKNNVEIEETDSEYMIQFTEKNNSLK